MDSRPPPTGPPGGPPTGPPGGPPTGPPGGGRSHHLVDPELVPLLDLYVDARVDAETLPDLRRTRAELAASTPPSADEVRRERRTVPGPAGAPEVGVLVYTPPGGTASRPGLLDVHGGGYVMGAADQYDELSRRTALEVDCVVVSVDYRLAPETPHPGPVEDCYAALVWFHAHAAELGVDPGRIAIKGESAGGGLAAATALVARDRGGPRLAFQHLVFPMLDDRTVTRADPHPFAGEFVWTPDSNRFGWESLLGTSRVGAADVSPYAAPARAEDLTGLPPTFLSCGALDLFLEEDLEYVRRLTRAGVPVELHVYPGAFHAFQNAAEARVAKQAWRDLVDGLRRGFGPPTGEVGTAAG